MNRWNYQWSRFKNQDEEVFLDWIYPTKLKDYKNKVVLDAGCGNGGYAKIVAKFAKKVIAIDKYSIEAARQNLKERQNVEIIEADIETFKSKEKYDAIFCVGVLHHLDNPKRGFYNLLKKLKRGGFINIWVYAKEGNWFMIHIIEPLKNKILLKMPLFFLRLLAYFLTSILYLLAWSVFLLAFNPPTRNSPDVSPRDVETLFRFGRISAPDEAHKKIPRPQGRGSFNFPYFQYFQKFRQHSFKRNLMNVFDKLNAPQTTWIEEKQIKEWFKGLDKVVIRHYNNISWSGFGIKK